MYGGRVIDSYDRRIIHTYMKEYFGDFVFDHIQPFHFFREKSSSEKYDYFVPEIRDFLSAKQRWLLKQANLSVCYSSFHCISLPRLQYRFQVEPQIEYNFEKFLSAKVSNLLHHSKDQIDYKSLSKNVLFNQFFHYSVFRDFYQAYVDQLPLYNPPDVLGLHGNAEINYLTKVANEIYANMILIQPEQNEIQDSSSRERKDIPLKTIIIKNLINFKSLFYP